MPHHEGELVVIESLQELGGQGHEHTASLRAVAEGVELPHRNHVQLDRELDLQGTAAPLHDGEQRRRHGLGEAHCHGQEMPPRLVDGLAFLILDDLFDLALFEQLLSEIPVSPRA